MAANMHFPLEKVKALKAYYKQCAAGLKGRPERSDYENAALLCEQLAAVMETERAAKPVRKKEPGADEGKTSA